MSAAPGTPHDLAEVVFRVGRAYGMTADRGIYQAVAVKDGRITAVGRSRDERNAGIHDKPDNWIKGGSAGGSRRPQGRARCPVLMAQP